MLQRGCWLQSKLLSWESKLPWGWSLDLGLWCGTLGNISKWKGFHWGTTLNHDFLWVDGKEQEGKEPARNPEPAVAAKLCQKTFIFLLLFYTASPAFLRFFCCHSWHDTPLTSLGGVSLALPARPIQISYQSFPLITGSRPGAFLGSGRCTLPMCYFWHCFGLLLWTFPCRQMLQICNRQLCFLVKLSETFCLWQPVCVNAALM